jgi:hypothetical protein
LGERDMKIASEDRGTFVGILIQAFGIVSFMILFAIAAVIAMEIVK